MGAALERRTAKRPALGVTGALVGCAFAALGALSPERVRGQAVDQATFLRVQDGADRCLRWAGLAAQLKASLEEPPEANVRIDLYPGPPAAFTVRRDGHVLGERVFARLPSDCRARRDAVALAMVLSLENLVGAKRASPRTPLILSKNQDGPAHNSPGLPPRPGRPAITASPGRASPLAPPPRARSDDTHVAPTTDAQVAPATDAQVAPTTDAQVAPATDARGAPPNQQPTTGPQLPIRSSYPDPPSPTFMTPDALAVGLAAGGGLLLGVQPGPAAALHLAVELGAAPLTLELAAFWSSPTAHRWDGGQGVTVRAEAAGGRLSACLGAALTPIRVDGCGGVLAAALLASGRGFTRDNNATATLLALTLGLRARLPSDTPLGIRLRADAQSNLVRPELRVVGTAPSAATLSVIGAAAFVELHVLMR